MRVQVTTRFRDKHTRELHKKGVYLDVTPERYAEIMSVGAFLRVIADEVQASTAETATETVEEPHAPPRDDLEGMTLRELREYAEKECKLNIPRNFKKTEIIETIRRTGK